MARDEKVILARENYSRSSVQKPTGLINALDGVDRVKTHCWDRWESRTGVYVDALNHTVIRLAVIFAEGLVHERLLPHFS